MSDPTHIHFLDGSDPEYIKGWYYSDEAGQVEGPYHSREQASAELDNYIKHLEGVDIFTRSFVGRMSGDGECFNWAVSLDEYKRIMGQERFDEEINFRRELYEGIKPRAAPTTMPIYIQDIIGYNLPDKYKFTITVEKIDG